MGRHDPGMADAHAAAARQLCQATRGSSRPLRIQRARATPRISLRRTNRDDQRPTLINSWKFPTQSNPGPTPGFTTPRSASGCSWRPKSCCSARCFRPTFCCASARARGYWPHGWLNIPVGTFNTVVLITSSVTVVHGLGVAEDEQFRPVQILPGLTIFAPSTFVGIKSFEYHDKFIHYEVWLKSVTVSTATGMPTASGHIEDNADVLGTRKVTVRETGKDRIHQAVARSIHYTMTAKARWRRPESGRSHKHEIEITGRNQAALRVRPCAQHLFRDLFHFDRRCTRCTSWAARW